jgi:hypothetical protein
MKRTIPFLVTAIIAAGGGQAAPAIPAPTAKPDITAALDYIAAVNGGDAAAVRRLRERDISAEFAQTIPEEAFVQFFRNQKRVTGGLDFVDARVRADAPNIIDAVVRDHVYGALHGVVLTLDGRADRRVSDFEPAELTPAWALPPGNALSPAEIGAGPAT